MIVHVVVSMYYSIEQAVSYVCMLYQQIGLVLYCTTKYPIVFVYSMVMEGFIMSVLVGLCVLRH